MLLPHPFLAKVFALTTPFSLPAGSLAAVPLLSQVLKVSDNYLALLGAFSSVADYTLYGLVSESSEFLVWIGKRIATDVVIGVSNYINY